MKKLAEIICLVSLISILLYSCNNDFPEVKKLSEYQQTVFTAYSEKVEANDKNVIYATSFLLAWDEIKNTIGNDLNINEEQYEDLYKMSLSSSHNNTLKKSEYTSNVQISKETISAKAYFKKTLNFEKEFESYNNTLSFNNETVKSFGLWGDDYDRSFMVKLLYYENDDDFIVKLLPEDTEHEIILYKTDSYNEICLNSLWNEVKFKIDSGISDKGNIMRAWRYQFEDEDKLEIPKIRFNIETNYSEFENAVLNTSETDYIITTAYQRTAFVLNEKGAIVESEAEMDITSAPPPDEEIPEPKKLIFDKPFLIILKRVDSKNAYFMMWVANTELMEK
ncbi:MAG: hypothetical protein K8R54_08340 [Bacteroidales bacterium]|nr:hypothetical protein [Bacteroidales bacterium]